MYLGQLLGFMPGPGVAKNGQLPRQHALVGGIYTRIHAVPRIEVFHKDM
jgi:hypothetical protein